MPVVLRTEANFMRLAPLVDIIVFPTNGIGSMGSGLGSEIKANYPDMYTEYNQLCIEEKLPAGSIHIFTDKKNIVINAITRRHYADHTELQDIITILHKLHTYLLTVPYYTVAMVMMGTGIGTGGQCEVEPYIHDILGDLPNIIHLSVRNDYVEKQPIYLGIIGSRTYTDDMKLELGTMEALLDWKINLKDIDAVVSGGANGVDTWAAGKDISDTKNSFAGRHSIKSIIAQADWGRYNKSAGMIRNRTVIDIATHVVAYVGKQSIGTAMAIKLLQDYNKTAESIGKPQKLLRIYDV